MRRDKSKRLTAREDCIGSRHIDIFLPLVPPCARMLTFSKHLYSIQYVFEP